MKGLVGESDKSDMQTVIAAMRENVVRAKMEDCDLTWLGKCRGSLSKGSGS